MEEKIKSLRRKLKTRNFIIVCMVLFVIAFLIYGFIQRAEVARQEQLAIGLAIEAKRCSDELVLQKQFADQAKDMAELQKIRAEEFAHRMEVAMAKRK